MKRRDFLKTLISCMVAAHGVPEIFAKELRKRYERPAHFDDRHLKDYLHKMRNFDSPFTKDVYLPSAELPLLNSTVFRLKRVQSTVGFGNFHLLNIDDAIKIAKSYSSIGSFSKNELTFMEKIFFHEASDYGFKDEKPLKGFTDRIDKNNSVKVPGTGNYLYKGKSLDAYNKIKKDLGKKVILTSGIRSIVKQFLLFLDKARRNDGNLSLASRSLAPPGYSFHSMGDFDVGQINFGVANFTSRFATSEVYQNLVELGYAKFRYEQDNLVGVRFEPWHIKLDNL